MRKVGLIAAIAMMSTLFVSCGSSNAASGGYFGVNSAKMNAKKQKEFKKPKHKICRKNSTKVKH